MKKIAALLLAIVICISLVVYNSNKKALEAAKAAYYYIDTAYEIVEQFSSDVYEAWRVGIDDRAELLEDGVAHLATQVSLSEAELAEGLLYTMGEIFGEDPSDASDESKAIITENTGLAFELLIDTYGSNLFEFSVRSVIGAYISNGKVDEAQRALNAAKVQMMELSEKYSDYEYYPDLKGYFTVTNSLFDFCQHPTGSFNQLEYTFNDYKNEARNYINNLELYF